MSSPQSRDQWQPTGRPPRGLSRPVRVDADGLQGPTKDAAGGPRWRQTSHGFYVPAGVDQSPVEQRILEQSMRLSPDHPGAVTGWSACRLHGAAFFDGIGRDGVSLLPVRLVSPEAQLRVTEASHPSRDRLDDREIVVRHGIRCVAPIRAVFDAAREATDLREAVVALDMAMAARLVSISQMRAYIHTRRRWRNVRQVERALDLASERSRSPYETRMRLIWVLDAGFPRPLVNTAVFSPSGQLLGVADLFDPEAAVFGEYDGAHHRSARRQSADLAREDRCRRGNLDFFRVTGPDMRSSAAVVERMTGARQRGLRRDRRRDAWTLDMPDWWAEDLSMDDEQAVARAVHGLDVTA